MDHQFHLQKIIRLRKIQELSRILLERRRLSKNCFKNSQRRSSPKRKNKLKERPRRRLLRTNSKP